MSDDLMEGFAAMMDAGILSPGQLRGMGMDPLMVMALGGGSFGGGHGFDEYFGFDDDDDDDGYGYGYTAQHQAGRGGGGRGRGGQARGGQGRGGYASGSPAAAAKGPPMQRCDVCDTTMVAANMQSHLAGKRHKQAVQQQQKSKATAKAAAQPAPPSEQPEQRSKTNTAASVTSSAPAWYEGLSQEAALQFFVDAYRLRIEDAFTLDGTLRGIYKTGNDKKVADADFDRFLKAAKKSAGLLPPWFDAALVKRASKQHIYTAVEAADLRDGVTALRSLADRIEGRLVLAKKPPHDDKNKKTAPATQSKGGGRGQQQQQQQQMWYEGRTKEQAIQFFIDAYRLRIEDSYTQLGDARGIYGGERREADSDFNGFLKAAGRAPQLLPPWWNAGEVRRAAKKHIYLAVEASDLKGSDEYGFMGVMALRTLADLVEGPLDPYDDDDDDDLDDDEFGSGGGGGGGRDRNMAALMQAMAMMHGGGMARGFDGDDYDDGYDEDEEEEEWEDDGSDASSEFNRDPTQMKPKGGGGTVEVLVSSDDEDVPAKPVAPAAAAAASAAPPKEYIPHLHKPKRGAYSMSRGDVIKLGVPVYSASSDGELARLAESRAVGDVRVLFVGAECTSAGLTAFAARAPRLQHFENRGSQITRDSLVAMAASCPQLEVVTANNVKDLDRQAAESILAALPRLKLFDLRGTDLGDRLRSPNAPPFDVKPGVLLEY